jgi:hypothetical protein
MRRTWAVAGTALLVATLTACGVPPAPGPASEPPEPVTSAPVPSALSPAGQTVTSVDQPISVVELATGSSSAVIRASGDGGFALKRIVYYDGPEPGPSHRIDGTTLVLGGCELPNCYFEYQVAVPGGVRVQGEAGSGRTTVVGAAQATVRSASGSVKLTDIAGPVDVASDSGPVSLSVVRGDVLVATASGPITGDALGGATTTVRSWSGPVWLALATVQTVQASTSSGPIRIAVPSGRYHVSAEAKPENTKVDVDDDPTASATISARSESGTVTVTATT